MSSRAQTLSEGGPLIKRPHSQNLHLTLSALAVMVLGLSLSILTSRWLGPTERGQFFAWQTWAVFVGFMAGVGLAPAVVIVNRKLPMTSVFQIANQFFASCVASVVGSALALALFRAPILAILGGAFLSLALTASGSILAVLQRNGQLGLQSTLARLCPLLPQIPAFFVAVGMGVSTTSGLFFAVGLGTFLGLLAILWFYRGPIQWSFPGLGARRRELISIQMTSYGQGQADTVTIAALAPPSVTAYYAIGAAARQVVMAFGSVLPTRAFHRDNSPETVKVDALATTLVSLVVALPLVLLAPLIVPSLWGPAFSSSVPAAQLLALAGVLSSTEMVVANATMRSRASQRSVAMAKLVYTVVVVILISMLSQSSIVMLCTAVLGATLALTVASSVLTWRLQAR